MPLKPIDVPQADSLALVRQVVSAVGRNKNPSVKELARTTRFSERHVRYRLATARALGLVTAAEDGAWTTPQGLKLLKTPVGGVEERRLLRLAVEACQAVQQIVPELLSSERVDIKLLADRIVKSTGLSQSTAERRAVVFRAWQRDLCDRA